ncbi:lycopene cyclase domain-containing protein [Microbacterium sp. 179-I 3D4 NHS]|uniref:lycopene cyclase domain-containing protein n=1 Tax=Microbacterium sp. 179-I 3D4 NHS TaxID=3142381 RepID=UPI0039A02C99
MTYLQLSAWFLAATVVAVLLLAIASRRRGPQPAAVGLTVLVMLTLTAVFDTLMIASGLFHYAAPQLVGIRIGLAPLEDFAYPLAGALLLPALWAALRARRGAPVEEDAS